MPFNKIAEYLPAITVLSWIMDVLQHILLGFIAGVFVIQYYRTKEREEYERRIEQLEKEITILLRQLEDKNAAIFELNREFLLSKQKDKVLDDLNELVKDLLEFGRRVDQEKNVASAERDKIKAKHERLLRFLN